MKKSKKQITIFESKQIRRHWNEEKELPDIRVGKENENYFYLHNDGDSTDDQKREWLIKNLNTYVNILRPRLKKWHKGINTGD